MNTQRGTISGVSPPVARLAQELNKLPGVGPKSAQRLAYYLVRLPFDEVNALAEAIIAVKEKIMFCSLCQNHTDTDPCAICNDLRRDMSQICIVEEPLDVLALERSRCYRGLYHVLHGVISPMNGIGPDELKIREFIPRLQDEVVKEVIIATNPTLEGDATAMYIRRMITDTRIKVTHLARGIPVGGDLEYADEVTLNRAFQGRQEL